MGERGRGEREREGGWVRECKRGLGEISSLADECE